MLIDSYIRGSGLLNLPNASAQAAFFHEQLRFFLEGRPSKANVYRTVYGPIRDTVGDTSSIVVHVREDSLFAAKAELLDGRWIMRDLGRWDHVETLSAPGEPEAYFDCIAQCLKPHLKNPYRIGLCLPCPLETTGSGRTVIRRSENTQMGEPFEGICPAEALVCAFERTGAAARGTIRVVSESVAVLLSAYALPRTSPENTAGFVMARGGEISYFEHISNAGTQTILTLCADKFAHLFDRPSLTGGVPIDPGPPDLGRCVLTEARRACSAECFTPAAARQLRATRSLSTQSLSAWLETPREDPTLDEKTFEALSHAMIHLLGQRMAACIAAVIRRVLGRYDQRVVFLIVEGAVFSASRILRTNLLEELHAVGPEYGVAKCRIAQVERAVLVGTACATLKDAPKEFPERSGKRAAG